MPTPRQISWAKLRVICVAITALVIFSVLAYLLTGGNLFEPKVTIYLYVNDATGLSTESPVSVDGIDIGKVESIALSGSKDPARTVRVTMKVARSLLASVPVDSITEISADSLIGDKFVDVQSGKSAQHIAPGGELNFRSQPEMMSRIDLLQFQAQISQIDAVITDIEQGRSLIGQFIQGNQMYTDVLHTLGQLESAFHTALATTAQVGGALYTDAMYQQLRQPFQQLDKALAEIQSGQGPAGRFVNSPADYEQWLQNLRDIDKQVESIGTSDFFQSTDTYRSLNQMVLSTISQVDAFNANPMVNNQSQYESWAGAAVQLRDGLRDFHRNPASYLHYRIF
jgi:ABC-type transporter Mla subunit MlaD